MSCFLLLERHPPVCLLLLSIKWRLASTRVSNKQPIGLSEWPIQPSQDFTLIAGMETPPLASTPSEIFPIQHSSLTCFSPYIIEMISMYVFYNVSVWFTSCIDNLNVLFITSWEGSSTFDSIGFGFLEFHSL